MPYSTPVTFAIAKVLTSLTRLLRPLNPSEQLQVLLHLVEAARSLQAGVRGSDDKKGT